MSYVCRACGKPHLRELLDMGSMPLAGDFHTGASGVRYPLQLDLCVTCGVVQVRHTVPHEVLFNDSYCYASSTVPALVQHFEAFAAKMDSFLQLSDKKVLEIGCNDGVFLRPLSKRAQVAVGVDASANVTSLAQAEGLLAIPAVFNAKQAERLSASYSQFDVVTCSNVFAHNPDLQGFLEGVKIALRVGGHFFVEVHDSSMLARDLQWDCFYHEHCFYWNEDSLRRLLETNGFAVCFVERTAMHGGALRVCAKRVATPTKSSWVVDLSAWHSFSSYCKDSAVALRDFCNNLPQGELVLYGVAGRAAMLVNYAGITDRISCAYDDSPLRAGKRVPGTDIPIMSGEKLGDRPDGSYVLLGPWHIASQVADRIAKRLPNKRFKFIKPLPRVETL